MKPVKGKHYWIEFGYNVYPLKCIAETEHGGIFNIPSIGGTEVPTSKIKAEADTPRTLWQMLFGKAAQ